jgi:thiamine biosynthesis lipoprotein
MVNPHPLCKSLDPDPPRPGFCIFILFTVTILLACHSDPADRLTVLQGSTMGTRYMVKITNAPGTNVLDQYPDLAQHLDAILDTVNQQMSTWIPLSEISRFNNSPDTSWFSVSKDLAFVVKKAQAVSEWSNGAFDITIMPLVNLWGFGPENRNMLVPDEQELSERLQWIGWQKLSVRANPPALKKSIPQLTIDLSAIAKGYGVDRLAIYLDGLGIEHYFVEIGGEVRVRGKNHLDQPWRVGISVPHSRGGLQKIVQTSRASIATSGDYYNYFEIDGERYSHTVDARTGRPITHPLASVTVVDSSCMMADAYATAINVLGPSAGMELALAKELNAFFIIRENNRFTEKMTPSFEQLLMNEK